MGIGRDFSYRRVSQLVFVGWCAVCVYVLIDVYVSYTSPASYLVPSSLRTTKVVTETTRGVKIDVVDFHLPTVRLCADYSEGSRHATIIPFGNVSADLEGLECTAISGPRFCQQVREVRYANVSCIVAEPFKPNVTILEVGSRELLLTALVKVPVSLNDAGKRSFDSGKLVDLAHDIYSWSDAAWVTMFPVGSTAAFHVDPSDVNGPSQRFDFQSVRVSLNTVSSVSVMQEEVYEMNGGPPAINFRIVSVDELHEFTLPNNVAVTNRVAAAVHNTRVSLAKMPKYSSLHGCNRTTADTTVNDGVACYGLVAIRIAMHPETLALVENPAKPWFVAVLAVGGSFSMLYFVLDVCCSKSPRAAARHLRFGSDGNEMEDPYYQATGLSRKTFRAMLTTLDDESHDDEEDEIASVDE